MTKYIFVTGGVCSGIGKGVIAASVANLLKRINYSVSILKCDPYINIDPGTLNPKQHGEVFVTRDGAETDLDIGHYERFIYQPLSSLNSISTGSIYNSVISKERKGDYKGHTVQIFHVIEEIKNRIYTVSQQNPDFLVVEVGGTVGDLESIPFLETIRQIQSQEDKENVLCIHVVYVPYLENVQEFKTKPAQHSIANLRSQGISPNLIVTRANKPLPKSILSKLSEYSYIPISNIIDCPNVDSIYKVPSLLQKQNVLSSLSDLLEFNSSFTVSPTWDSTLNVKLTSPTVKVALVGKYTSLKDSYLSVIQALKDSCNKLKTPLHIDYIDVTTDYSIDYSRYDGFIIPGGFGENGTEDILEIIQYCREHNYPTFGICMGMQLMCIEYARNVLNLQDANSTEFDPFTPYPVIDLLEEKKQLLNIGGTLRKGIYPCSINKDSKVFEFYNNSHVVYERHRHRYEFNNAYRGNFVRGDLTISGTSVSNSLVEIINLENKTFYVGTQFHPEFESNLLTPHPLFISFIESCLL